MTNNYAQQSFQYLLFFFPLQKNHLQFNKLIVINARLYICANPLPFSTST